MGLKWTLSPRAVAGAVLLLTIAAAESHSQAPPALDIILRNGTVIDGTGLPPYRADVAIANGHIASIGNLSTQQAATELDVTGLYVTPGFINIHSHPSPGALPYAENMLQQGVTTEIMNADGGGPLEIGALLSQLKDGGLAVNVGAYVGFNSAWSAVVGAVDRRPSADEIVRMGALLDNGLRQGAWGVSAGLDYKPAYFATTQEVIAVVSAARKWRTNFTNHDRLMPESNYSSRVAVAETMTIADAAGLVPVVTHMKIQGHEQGASAEVLGKMQQATRRGKYTAADVYPYLAGQTALSALIIPAWAQDGGREAMLKRFADPALRGRIVTEAEQAIKARLGSAESITIMPEQKRLVDVMKELQAGAGEAVLRVLEQSNPSAIMKFGSEDDLRNILRYADASIACDCGATRSTTTHPRAYGTFPRVLGHYVREQRLLTWEDAIRKMSSLPAATIGMVDRGFLAPGAVADVTIFDPATIIDRATYESPALAPIGVRHVIVHGRIALRDGVVTGEQAGMALARTTHMPSRPMSMRASRRVRVKGMMAEIDAAETSAGEIQVALDVRQGATDRTAKGSFKLTDVRSNIAIDTKQLGVLQVAPSWASFTGRGRLRAGSAEESFTVVIEQADPSTSGTTITVTVEGVEVARGRLAPTLVRIGI